MSEVEEASRVVIMLGQLLVPGAQELARLLARAVDDALSQLDGHGSLAWVDGLILLALALLVAYVLFEWHEVTRATLLADALDRVLAMRAARRGESD